MDLLQGAAKRAGDFVEKVVEKSGFKNWVEDNDDPDDSEEELHGIYNGDKAYEEFVKDVDNILHKAARFCVYDSMHEARWKTYGSDYARQGRDDFEHLNSTGHVPKTSSTDDVEAVLRRFIKCLLELEWSQSIGPILKNRLKKRMRAFLRPIGSFPCDTKVGDLDEFDYLMVLNLPLPRNDVAPFDAADAAAGPDRHDDGADEDISYLIKESDSILWKAYMKYGWNLNNLMKLSWKTPGNLKQWLPGFEIIPSKHYTPLVTTGHNEAYSPIKRFSCRARSHRTNTSKSKAHWKPTIDIAGIDFGNDFQYMLQPFTKRKTGYTKVAYVSNVYHHGPATCVEITWTCRHSHTHTVGVDISLATRLSTKSNLAARMTRSKLEKNLLGLPVKMQTPLLNYIDKHIYIYPMYSDDKQWVYSSCVYDEILFETLWRAYSFDFRKLFRCMKLIIRHICPRKVSYDSDSLGGCHVGSLVSSHILKCIICELVIDPKSGELLKGGNFGKIVTCLLKLMKKERREADEDDIWPVARDLFTGAYVSFVPNNVSSPLRDPTMPVTTDISGLIDFLGGTLGRDHKLSSSLSKDKIYFRAVEKLHVGPKFLLTTLQSNFTNEAVYFYSPPEHAPYCKNQIIQWCVGYISQLYAMNRGQDLSLMRKPERYETLSRLLLRRPEVSWGLAAMVEQCPVEQVSKERQRLYGISYQLYDNPPKSKVLESVLCLGQMVHVPHESFKGMELIIGDILRNIVKRSMLKKRLMCFRKSDKSRRPTLIKDLVVKPGCNTSNLGFLQEIEYYCVITLPLGKCNSIIQTLSEISDLSICLSNSQHGDPKLWRFSGWFGNSLMKLIRSKEVRDYHIDVSIANVLPGAVVFNLSWRCKNGHNHSIMVSIRLAVEVDARPLKLWDQLKRLSPSLAGIRNFPTKLMFATDPYNTDEWLVVPDQYDREYLNTFQRHITRDMMKVFNGLLALFSVLIPHSSTVELMSDQRLTMYGSFLAPSSQLIDSHSLLCLFCEEIKGEKHPHDWADLSTRVEGILNRMTNSRDEDEDCLWPLCSDLITGEPASRHSVPAAMNPMKTGLDSHICELLSLFLMGLQNPGQPSCRDSLYLHAYETTHAFNSSLWSQLFHLDLGKKSMGKTVYLYRDIYNLTDPAEAVAGHPLIQWCLSQVHQRVENSKGSDLTDPATCRPGEVVSLLKQIIQ